MNSFNNNLSHKTQLIAAAAAASIATAGIIQAYNLHAKRIRRKELDEEIKRSISDLSNESLQEPQIDYPEPSTEPSRQAQSLDYDEELIREQLARNYAFFGEEGMAKIRQGRVVVVGCGGVGSWAAVMLVRS
jgi:tRNA U34 5-carboxymethylaminomethyl modifying GTPase MnmE/TrmE